MFIVIIFDIGQGDFKLVLCSVTVFLNVKVHYFELRNCVKDPKLSTFFAVFHRWAR